MSSPESVGSVTPLTYSPQMTNGLIDIQAVLETLAETRPVFHSEADFQFAFAWTAAQLVEGLKVRLEVRQPNGRELDLMLTDESLEHQLAIEFKHLTIGWSGSIGGEHFQHGKPMSENLGRRGIVEDIERIEDMVRNGDATAGAVVVLTNNDTYWKKPRNQYCGSINYRVHEEAILKGELIWHPRNKNPTKRPITLNYSYTASWSDFSNPAGGPGPFKSLVFETP